MSLRARTDRTGADDAAPGVPYTLSEKINVCRGLFAILVVSSHAWTLAHVVDPRWSEAPSVLRDLIHSVVGEGLHYVMGFFVISGYCIQCSVRRLGSDGRFPLKTYMIARATRILPLYYTAFLFAVVVEALIGSHRPPFWTHGLTRAGLFDQVFVLQGFTRPYGSFAPSWSITNEFVYYVMFGLLAAATAAARTRVRPAVVGLFITVGLAVGFHVLYGRGLNSPIMYRCSLLFGLGSLWFLGAMVADSGSRFLLSPMVRRASACWPLVLGLAVVMWYSQVTRQRNIYLTSGFAFTLLIIRFRIQELAAGPMPKRRPRPYTETLGLVSYPIYLFHGPILEAVGAAFNAAGVQPAWWVLWPAATLASVGVGWIVAVLIERPFIAWRAGLLERMKRSSSAARDPVPIAVPSLGVPQ
jgi:peptidoglycan/LPS O-acetylase OafA/YrhL